MLDSILGYKTTIIASLITFCVGIILAVYFTSTYLNTKHDNELKDIQLQSAKILQQETEKVIATERKLSELVSTTEKQLNEKQRALKTANDRISKLIAASGVVFIDPNAKPTGTCDTDTGSSSSSNGTTGSQLSPETAGFLWSEAGRADAAVTQLQGCQEYVNKLRELLNSLVKQSSEKQ